MNNIDNKLRPIAIYLPQFHPIPENDEWWGKGFTEWTNVSKAKPLYKHHNQPDLPADLGFYDLRVPETRENQAKLAKEHGIYGFCYYHYWFNGRRILERPFQEVFESGKPDFPFMLCWANENWTKIWDGSEKEVLLSQTYSPEDDLLHIQSLIPYFKDPRYIRIDNKPVFSVYRSDANPNMSQTINIWRKEAALHGIELYLCRFESFGTIGKSLINDGFDAAIDFQPHTGLASGNADLKPGLKDRIDLETISRSINFRFNRLVSRTFNFLKKEKELKGLIVPFSDIIQRSLDRYKKKQDYTLFRSVCVGFDNSPRKKEKFVILEGNDPKLFKNWLSNSLQNFEPNSKEENLFFINAWNEWAEGNHLEPGMKWGKSYLEAVKEVLDAYNQKNFENSSPS